MNWKMQRIRQEAALSAAGFSTTRRADFDPDDGRWVIIRDVPLPDVNRHGKLTQDRHGKLTRVLGVLLGW